MKMLHISLLWRPFLFKGREGVKISCFVSKPLSQISHIQIQNPKSNSSYFSPNPNPSNLSPQILLSKSLNTYPQILYTYLWNPIPTSNSYIKFLTSPSSPYDIISYFRFDVRNLYDSSSYCRLTEACGQSYLPGYPDSYFYHHHQSMFSSRHPRFLWQYLNRWNGLLSRETWGQWATPSPESSPYTILSR